MVGQIKVLHVIPQLGLGGSEGALLTLVREMVSLGVTSEVCVLGSENAFPDRLRDLSHPVFLKFSNSHRDVFGFVRCAWRVRMLVQARRPDIVHSHLWPAARMVGFALRRIHTPHVVHVQDTRDWLTSRGRRARMMRILTRAALQGQVATYIAVSEAVRQYTIDALPWINSAIHVIHNGADAMCLGMNGVGGGRPSSGGDVFVGTAGRLAPEKGHKFLLQAVAEARQRGVPLKLLIAGEGAERKHIERLIAELGLRDTTSLLGLVSDMAAFYEELDIFVQPSVSSEGLPLTVLEAMLTGCAVVATDVGGVSEVVRHGVDGLVVPGGDSDALAHAIEHLSRDVAARQRLSACGHQRVKERFTGRHMARACVDTYSRIVVDHPRV